MHIKELLDESRSQACDGFRPDHVCVKIAAIAYSDRLTRRS